MSDLTPFDSSQRALNAMSLTDGEFRTIADIAHREAGLLIPSSKQLMVQARVQRHLRDEGFADVACMIAALETSPDARERLISVLTTNVSSFFREDHHFKALETSILPDLLTRARQGGRVRIWSAGCSSGQEPYSIAMQLRALARDIAQLDIRILATDIDRRILEKAIKGCYSVAESRGIPDNFKTDPTLVKTVGDQIRISDVIRNFVSFKHLNLLSNWPMSGQFDVIFCRNVVIYFDRDTQDMLWKKFRAQLAPGGRLFLGHSERVPTPERLGLRPDGVTTYIAERAPGPAGEPSPGDGNGST